MAQTVEVRMNSLSVLFQDGSSPSYFSRKLFKFAAYVNPLDHLDCSYGALAVLHNKFVFQKAKFFTHLWKQLLELGLVLCLLTIWISDCLCLAHIAGRNQDEYRSSSSHFLRKMLEFRAMRICLIIWIAVMLYWHFFF